jgi:dTDP-4-dehydrorhamnose reductase
MDPQNPTPTDHESTTSTGSQPPSLLIIGVDGMIGSALAQEASRRGIPWQGTSRRPGAHWHLDLAGPPEKWQLPAHADIAILCAARTKLADCESNPAETRAINVTATIALADRLARNGTTLAFLSTSRVFGPSFELPSESTQPEPATEYGRQKLSVEKHLLAHQPSAKIIRPAKVVSNELPLFRNWHLALDKGQTIHPYADLFLSPISLDLLISQIFQIALCDEFGIFHLSAKDAVSYFEAASVFAESNGFRLSQIRAGKAPVANTAGSSVLCSDRPLHKIGMEPLSALENLKHAFSGRTSV